MFYYFLLLLFLLGGLICRVRDKRRAYRLDTGGFPVEPSSSLLSQAIVELLASAGGIYLSLVMVTSFLQIEVQQKFICGCMEVDLLAFLSIVLALAQPILLRAFWLVSK